MKTGMDCPYCQELVNDLEDKFFRRRCGMFDCPHCGQPLRVVLENRYWLVGNRPEDQAMRAAGAPTLLGLE